MIFNKKGFTLVELVIVAVILVILGTLGFSSYASHIVSVRDTTRIADLNSIGGGLSVALTKGRLSHPDDSVEIKASGSLIGYQGYAGESVLSSIRYVDGGKDPRDETYYSYYMTKNRKHFQLLGFLEDNTNLQTNLISSTYAAIDYSLRTPTVAGNKLGIFTGNGSDLNTPVQEISAVQSAGELDIGTTTTEYISHVTNIEKVIGDNAQLISMIPNASCKRILEVGSSRGDGVYKISPNGGGNNFQVYCDMTHEGGGWTMIWKNFGGPKYADYGTNVSNSTLFASSTGSYAAPYYFSKTFGSEKNVDAWDTFLTHTGVELVKITKAYSGGILMDVDDTYTYDGRLDLGDNVSFGDLFTSLSDCKNLNNQVSLYLNGSLNGQSDKLTFLSGNSVGFDNGNDCSQPVENTIPKGQDFLSYQHLNAGQNVVRCQFDCWDGTENIVQETVWGIRKK